MGILTKMRTLGHYFRGNSEISFSDFIDYTFFRATVPLRVRKIIDKIDLLDDNSVKVSFKPNSICGVDLSKFVLYAPKSMDKSPSPLTCPTPIREVVGEILLRKHYHCYEKIKQTEIEPSDTVVDCGSAEGLFGLLALAKGANVIAIEPVPSFCEHMKKTFSQFEKNKWTILKSAISDVQGNAYVIDNSIFSSITNEPKTNGVDNPPVEIKPLDQLLDGRDVSYIKADLEGFDYELLISAEETIKRCRPKLAITTYHKKEHFQQMRDFIKKIVPEYVVRGYGICSAGSPYMLHAWVE